MPRHRSSFLAAGARFRSGCRWVWPASAVAFVAIWLVPERCVSQAYAGVRCRRVAFRGDAVPGEAAGTTYGSFYFPSTYELPSINDEGRALFSASVSTPAGYMRRLYIESGAGVQRIAEVGQQAPGAPEGVTLRTFDWATANDVGEVAFVSQLWGPGMGSDDRGVWRWDAGGLHKVMQESTPVGGHMPGYTYSNYISGFRHAGRYVSYNIGLLGPGYAGEATMAGPPEMVQVVARYGDQAPGTVPGTVFSRFTVDGSNRLHQLNDSGAVAFRATVKAGWRGIWAGGVGSLALVAAPDTPAPGAEPGALFSGEFTEPGLNSAGQVAFRAQIKGDGVGANNLGIWAGKPGALRLVVRRNGPLPGFPPDYGLDYQSHWDVVVNAAGRVAFYALLRGPGVTGANDNTIWCETAAGLKMVVREGDAHPSLPAGVTLGVSSEPSMNARGQVAFSSSLRGDGLYYPRNQSLWLTDRDGTPHLVAWSGVPFEVAPGDFRAISSFSWTVNSGGGGQGGRWSGLNDRGELVFSALFQDGGEGVFAARIDEPPVQCDAGGPYEVECAGAATTVALDGTGSSALDASPLTYAWTTNCPGAAFDDPASPTPMLTVDASTGCNLNCAVTLTVSDGVHPPVSCDTTVSVSDSSPPSISCPGDAVVNAGEPTDPSATGNATATDACDPAPIITHADAEATPPAPADPVLKTIVRTWTATDTCGLIASCEQRITVLKLSVGLDIRPGSCPNPLNRKSRGVLPVALLGGTAFDVSAVDTATLRLMRADGTGRAVEPLNGPRAPRLLIKDVGARVESGGCECGVIEGDGIDDLSMKFSTPDLVAAFELGESQPGTTVEVVLVGTLFDGTVFRGVDCLQLVPKSDADKNSVE
jgi:hypothetical protein